MSSLLGGWHRLTDSHSFPESFKPRAVNRKLRELGVLRFNYSIFSIIMAFTTSLGKLLNAIVFILGENSNTSASSVLVQQL